MVELLAPAGDKECFKAALMAGADAIYVGGNKYGARAYATNFETEDLLAALDLAHLFGKKVYLTINTLMKDQELDGLDSFLFPYYEAGLDGVIIQDLGALRFVRERFPGLELHASTQMTVTGSYGASLLKSYGVSRVVPARELSLAEIRAIKEETGLEIETFIHGAMCYGYSGQCLFSSMLGERSGNRGRCAGPCRLPYQIEYNGKKLNSNDELYQLSLKDLCVLESLPHLMEAGIDSFKIEGRMKTPEYVSFVTGMYRKYMDLYLENSKKYKVSEEDLSLLKNQFSRGSIQSGYYFQHNGRELVTLNKPGYQSYAVSKDVSNQGTKEQNSREMPCICVEGHFVAKKEEPICFYVNCQGKPETIVAAAGDIAMKAQKCPATLEDVKKQLIKTGNTCFDFSQITIDMEEDLFLSKKELNELRRSALHMLQEQLLEGYRRSSKGDLIQKGNVSKHRNCGALRMIDHYWQIEVRTLEQFLALEPIEGMKRVYVSSDMLTCLLEKTMMDSFFFHMDELRADGIEIYLRLPSVVRRETMKIIDSYRNIIERINPEGFCIGNLESLAYIKEKYPQKRLVTDAGMHLFNSDTTAFYEENHVYEHIFSYELHKKEVEEIVSHESARHHSFILPVYGYIPLMVSAGCLLKTNNRCRRGTGDEFVYLIDRQKKKRVVITHCDRCENTIYNSVPLSLHKETQKIQDMALQGVLMKFTIETAKEMRQIINYFTHLYVCDRDKSGQFEGNNGGETPYSEFTKGHFMKGVE